MWARSLNGYQQVVTGNYVSCGFEIWGWSWRYNTINNRYSKAISLVSSERIRWSESLVAQVARIFKAVYVSLNMFFHVTHVLRCVVTTFAGISFGVLFNQRLNIWHCILFNGWINLGFLVVSHQCTLKWFSFNVQFQIWNLSLRNMFCLIKFCRTFGCNESMSWFYLFFFVATI